MKEIFGGGAEREQVMKNRFLVLMRSVSSIWRPLEGCLDATVVSGATKKTVRSINTGVIKVADFKSEIIFDP